MTAKLQSLQPVIENYIETNYTPFQITKRFKDLFDLKSKDLKVIYNYAKNYQDNKSKTIKVKII
jgi:hypothetical protein